MLQSRLFLLSEVERMTRFLNVSRASFYSYSCESSSIFWVKYVLPGWSEFIEKYRSFNSCYASAGFGRIKANFSIYDFNLLSFPFMSFFEGMGVFRVFRRGNMASFYDSCFLYVKGIFQELDESRPLEIMRREDDRIQYCLCGGSRVVATTCSFTNFRRSLLICTGFKFDSLVIEEAGQLIEAEAWLPSAMQDWRFSTSYIRRVAAVGDDMQINPVINCMTIRTCSRFDESLICRLVRLGFPYVQL